MVRQEWSLVGFAVCSITGAGVFAPVFVPFVLSLLSKTSASTFTYAIGVAISAAISLLVTAVFYRVNVGVAKDLLKKAEV